MLSVTRELTPAEILALSTSPVALLPAKVGVVYVPFYVSFYKAAGVAYTSADLVLESTDGVEFALADGAGFLAQSAEAVLAQKIVGGSIDALGVGLQLRLSVAATTGDQPVRVKLSYLEQYPGLAD